MTNLPISICLFTSTKGHFGHSTYLDTLRHLDRQIPLSQFGKRYAHIKVSSDQRDEGVAMELALMDRGFAVDATVGDWSRGMSHQNAYLLDQRKASQSRVLQSQPFMLLLEDDSVMECHTYSLADCLSRMVTALEEPLIMSTRFIRRCDWDGGVPVLDKTETTFFSPHFDFQPAVIRSRDYLIANKVIEDNWESLKHLQCEMVMRMALDTMSRAPLRHLVWLPHVAESIHLGVPDYPSIKASLNL